MSAPAPCEWCRTYHPGTCSTRLLAEGRIRPWTPGGRPRRCAVCREPVRDDYLVLRVKGRVGAPTAPFHRGCAQIYLAAVALHLRERANLVE
ncbi:MAG TPA: hypothetical protein VFL91_21275 [Thermomicrobiales bacterium]|nr:hypothetical protein [Thermomicrobiales bacterium]